MSQKKLEELFYKSPKQPSLVKLIELSGITPSIVKDFYMAQPIVQIHQKPHPKSKLFNHFQIDIPYERFETDLLFLPNDSGFRYCLTVIDCASRYKWVAPVKSKTASAVLNAFLKITKQENYKKPKTLVADDGSEFKGEFKRYMEENGIDFTQNTKGNYTAFAERFNGLLSINIFKRQQQRELETGKVSKVWIKDLQPIVEEMNNTVTSMIKMKPVDAIKLDIVPQQENSYSQRDANTIRPIGTIVRYLLKKDEIQNPATKKFTTERRRLTDPIWSIGTYKVVNHYKSCKRCLVYHQLEPIDDARDPGRRFPYWQLQKV